MNSTPGYLHSNPAITDKETSIKGAQVMKRKNCHVKLASKRFPRHIVCTSPIVWKVIPEQQIASPDFPVAEALQRCGAV